MFADYIFALRLTILRPSTLGLLSFVSALFYLSVLFLIILNTTIVLKTSSFYLNWLSVLLNAVFLFVAAWPF